MGKQKNRFKVRPRLDGDLDPDLDERDLASLGGINGARSAPRVQEDAGAFRKAFMPQLDLHNKTVEFAQRRILNFLLTEQGRGSKECRIIVGKGLHSPGEPVLKERVPGIIDCLVARGPVRSWVWEDPKKGPESGSIIVRLK